MKNQSRYRSNSHAGFPKGAFADPHPVHYHIARCNQIVKITTPNKFKSANYQRGHYVYSARSSYFPDINSHVTINLNDRQKTSFTLPITVIKDFIFPFASALNFIQSAPCDSTSSQTSYLNRRNCAIKHTATQYIQESESENETKGFTTDEELSDFEYDILRKLRSNLVSDITNKVKSAVSDSDLSIETECLLLETKMESKAEKTTENESNEIPIDLNNNNNNNNSVQQANGGSSSTGDEGFDGSLNGSQQNSDALALHEPSAVVAKMSEEILDYLKRQCYEIKELVLFPEVLYDQNVQKLMNKLKILYDEYCSPLQSEEEKNELRIHIATEVLTQLHLSDVSSASPEGSFVSDKVFSTSEFVSDILDKFFHYLTQSDNSFNSFKESLVCGRSEVSSTPDIKHIDIDSVYDDAESSEVTSFKRDVAQKTGSESFWIAISKSSSGYLPRSPSCPRKVINVDDIPLKPPPDILNRLSLFERSRLSPIVEEARKSLIFDDGSDGEAGMCVDTEYDVLAGGDNKNNDTYIAFERPEINIVCDSTQFHRTNTINTTSYVTKSVVQFSRGSEILDNSDSLEGDWMGYEKAKF